MVDLRPRDTSLDLDLVPGDCRKYDESILKILMSSKVSLVS